MRGRWLTGGTLLTLTSAALVLSCAARKPDVGKHLQEKMTNLRHSEGRAATEGIEKELVSPDQEAAQRAGRAPQTLRPGEPIWLQSGKSRVVHVSRPIRRLSVGNPEIAGVVVLGPESLMINAKPLPELKGMEARQRAGAAATMMQSSVTAGTLLGRTLTAEPRMAETSLVIWDEMGEDVHTVTIADFLNQQVMLEVTIAEMDRTAMEEHGIDVRAIQNDFIAASFMGGGGGPAVPGQTTTVPPQTSQPLLPLTLTATNPTYAFIFPNQDITAFIQAMQTEGLARVLAQPMLLAMSGQNAVFQVGGEIPIRIATGFAANIEFKAFGTLVNFVPRVSEDGDIMLTVTPEVSAPDYSNEVEGIPTFRTRRASTSARLRNGETLVIGGLLQTTVQEQQRGVPYLKDIPYLGYLFRTTTYSNEEDELMVVVTPRLVHPLAPTEQVQLPTDRGPLTNEDVRTKPSDAEVTRPRLPVAP